MRNGEVTVDQRGRFWLFLKSHARSKPIPSDATARLQLFVVAGAWIVVGLLILLAIYVAIQIKGQG